MKRILPTAVAILLVGAVPADAAAQDNPPAQSDNAARVAEARSIMAIRFPPEAREAMFVALYSQVRHRVENAIPSNLTGVDDPGLTAIFNDYRQTVSEKTLSVYRLHAVEFVDAIAVAYAHEFSLEELKAIQVFARTSAGRHFLTRSTDLANDPAVVASLTAIETDVGKIMLAEHKPFAAKLDAYLKDHPEVTKKLTAAHSGS